MLKYFQIFLDSEIDKLCPFNSNEFESTYNDIDSDKLELIEENEDTCKASF